MFFSESEIVAEGAGCRNEEEDLAEEAANKDVREGAAEDMEQAIKKSAIEAVRGHFLSKFLPTS